MRVKHIVLAGGCFWGLQALLNSFKGIISTTVGYANASTKCSTSMEAQTISFLKDAAVPSCKLSYKDVCSDNTMAAEAVAIEYDADLITLHDIHAIFFSAIDPTTQNRQGNDVGSQYRSGIYYLMKEKDDDFPVIRKELETLQQSYKKPIVIEVAALQNYTVAEEYHQDYLEKNPGGYCHINVTETKQKFAHLL